MSESKTPRTVEQRLEEWLKQPGTAVTQAERMFIEVMRQLAKQGVGYGLMQQVIEWEWQAKGLVAWGPEYFNERIATLESELVRLQAELQQAQRDLAVLRGAQGGC